jgi:hypothetical protein
MTTSLSAQRFNNVIGVIYQSVNSVDNDYNISATYNPPKVFSKPDQVQVSL